MPDAVGSDSTRHCATIFMLPEKPDDEASSDKNPSFGIGLKQLFLANDKRIYILLDGTQKWSLIIYIFITFMVRRGREERRVLNDDGKMTVYVGNSARKTKMIPILETLVSGGPEKSGDPCL